MPINQLKYAQRYERLRAKGVSEAEAHRQATEYATTVAGATRKSLAGENIATKDVINRLRKGGMSDDDIEASGIYKFGEEIPRSAFAEVLAAIRTRMGRRELLYGPKTYLHETPEERSRRVALYRKRGKENLYRKVSTEE